jgi:hypothetical protein
MWYKNPDAVSVVQDHMVRATVKDGEWRRMLHLVPGLEAR